MVPNQQALTVRWTGCAGDGEIIRELEFLRELHVTGDPRWASLPGAACPAERQR